MCLNWPNMGLLYYNYKQKNDWTCGPAIARTILHHFGEKVSIAEMIRILRTTRKGTSHKNVLRFFRKKEHKFFVRKNAQLKDIKKYLKNYWIIVAYLIPSQKEYHYSIVKHLNTKRIYFHDTWFGSSHSYTLAYFLKNWKDDEVNCWMLVVKK